MNISTDITAINRLFGNSDLFLIDQILKGLFKEGATLFDAGCGEGRNISYFMRNNFKLYGIDLNPSALMMLRFSARAINPGFSDENFIVGDLRNIPFEENSFDYILCISVLHSAENENDFIRIIENLVRTLKVGGILIVGMDSVFGIESEIVKLDNGLYRTSDGNTRFLLTRELLKNIPVLFRLELIESPKTIMIHHQKSTTYLILKKPG